MVGSTPLDFARKNPFGVMWFDTEGQLRPMEKKRRDSSGTIIEDLYDDTGESTLVGSEQPYVVV